MSKVCRLKMLGILAGGITNKKCNKGCIDCAWFEPLDFVLNKKKQILEDLKKDKFKKYN